jgi:hypothetical protein
LGAEAGSARPTGCAALNLEEAQGPMSAGLSFCLSPLCHLPGISLQIQMKVHWSCQYKDLQRAGPCSYIPFAERPLELIRTEG